VSRFVVDASVVLTWCFPDENAALAQKVADMLKRGDSAIAPSFWPHEVLNGLLVGEKRKRVSSDLVGKFLADLAMLPIELEQVPSEEVFGQIRALCRGHGLTTYDAAYLQLAKIRGLALATLDEELIRACRKAGVELV
jgi:predicted nucleic acid-binding protein